MAKIMSVARMMATDGHRPTYPATMPATVPMIPAIATATQAILSDTARPCRTSENMSRPNWSVPAGWLKDGDFEYRERVLELGVVGSKAERPDNGAEDHQDDQHAANAPARVAPKAPEQRPAVPTVNRFAAWSTWSGSLVGHVVGSGQRHDSRVRGSMTV